MFNIGITSFIFNSVSIGSVIILCRLRFMVTPKHLEIVFIMILTLRPYKWCYADDPCPVIDLDRIDSLMVVLMRVEISVSYICVAE